MSEIESSELPVLVLDIPHTMDAETATKHMSEQYDRGFYIHRALDWGGGCRVIFVRSGESDKRKQEAREKLKQTANDALEAAASAIYKRNPAIGWLALKSQLEQAGFRKGSDWARDALDRLRAARLAR